MNGSIAGPRFGTVGEGDESDMANFETVIFVFKCCLQTWFEAEAVAAGEGVPARMLLGEGEKCSGFGATSGTFKH